MPKLLVAIMDEFIPISTLNDFIFCPYSIYLHNVYMEADEDIYSAVPQLRGKNAHMAVDNKSSSSSPDVIESLSVVSSEFGIFGKIDIYKKAAKMLVERKYMLSQIFRGQIYQLWGQYFCMKEMGYEIDCLAFYEISTHKSYPVDLPGEAGRVEFVNFLTAYRTYNPLNSFIPNENKCRHCIYSNLCDKTTFENVYS